MNPKPGPAPILAIMFLSAAGAFSQELAPRRLECSILAPAALSARAGALLDFLKIELLSGTAVVLHEDIAAPSGTEDSGAAAEEPDVRLEFSVEEKAGGSFLVKATAWDSRKPATPAFTVEETLKALSSEATKGLFTRIVKSAASSFPPLPPQVVEKVVERVVEETQVNRIERGVTLAILAPPGTRLGIQGRKKKEVVPESGRFELELPQSTLLSYRAELTGRMPVDRSVFLEKEDKEDEVPFERIPPFELSAGLKYANLSFIPSLRWYPVPARLFVSVAFETSYASLVKRLDDDRNWTIDYLEPRLGGGLWLSPEDARIRFAATLEACARWEVFGTALNLAQMHAFSAAPGGIVELVLSKSLAIGLWGTARVSFCPYDHSADPAFSNGNFFDWFAPHWMAQLPEPSVYARLSL